MRGIDTFVASLVISSVSGAGMTTHNVVARRATEFERFIDEETKAAFGGLNHDRIDALQGGAPYPDYLYACGDDHNAGEEAHWTPFQQAAATYIRETYPDWVEQGRESDGAGLVAFMSGVVSHYIVDQNWHGLCDGCDSKGFIKNIGYADFNCTGDLCLTAHTATDTGGEFVASNQMNISWYPQQNWYIPVDDLVNIYILANQSLTEPQYIRECSVVFYAGSWAVSTFGNLIYPIIAKHLGEFLTGNRYVDHSIGGVDDDAAWTAFMQTRWANWVTYGPPTTCKDCGGTLNNEVLVNVDNEDVNNDEEDELLKMLNNRKDDPPFKAKRIWMNSMKKLFREEEEKNINNNNNDNNVNNCFEVKEVGNHGGISIEYKSGVYEGEETFLKKIAHVLIYDFLDVVDDEDGGWLTLEEKEELEYLLFQKVEQIVSSSSSSSSSLSNNVNKDLEEQEVNKNVLYDQTVLLQGWGSHQQLGYALDTYDVDQDGCFDVLVGSPGYSDTGHPQTGLVELYFCPSSTSSSTSNPNPNEESSLNPKVVFGSYTNETNEVYERFGATVKFANLNSDEDMDVIICSPLWGGENVMQIVGNYTGYCGFYLGPFPSSSSSSKVLPNKVIFGDRPWGIFGEQVIVGDVTGDGVDDVIISAPQAGNDEDDYTNQGEVYVFETTVLFNGADNGTMVHHARDVASHVLTSNFLRQHFGHALELGYNNTLLIGAPYFHIEGNNGAVGQFSAYDLKTPNTNDVAPLYTITGCHHASRIGASFAMNHETGVLALSEIGYNSTENSSTHNHTWQRDHLRSGRVHFIDLSQLDETGRNYSLCEDADFDLLVGQTIYPSQADIDLKNNKPVVHVRKYSEARFGYLLKWNQENNELAIGAPGALSNSGILFIYLSNANQGSGALLSIHDDDELNRNNEHETALSSYGRFSSAFSWFENHIIISSPRSCLFQQAPDYEEFGEIKVISPKH